MSLYAWITTAPDGETSMVGVLSEFGHIPLVTVRETVATGVMRELALGHGSATKQPVWLVRYRHDGVLEEHLP